MNNAFWAGEAIANGMELDSLRNTISQCHNEIYSRDKKINDLTSQINTQKNNETATKARIYQAIKTLNCDPNNIIWKHANLNYDLEGLRGDVAQKCYYYERRNRDIFEKVIMALKEKYNIPDTIINDLTKKFYTEVKDQPLKIISMSSVGSAQFRDDFEHKQIMDLLDRIKIMLGEREQLKREMNSIAAMLAPAPAPAPASPAPAATAPAAEASAPAAPTATAAAPVPAETTPAEAPAAPEGNTAAEQAPAQEAKAGEGAAPAPEASALATELEEEKAEHGLISRMFGGSGKKSK